MNTIIQLQAAAEGHITTSTYAIVSQYIKHTPTTKHETLQRLAIIALSLIQNYQRPLLDNNHD